MSMRWSRAAALVLLACAAHSENTAALPFPAVDQRVELVSIAFHLAGAPEFAGGADNPYRRAVEEHFRRFASHPLVKRLRQLIEQSRARGTELGAWEAMSLAMHVSDPPELKPLAPITDATRTDDWDDRTLLRAEFLTLLRKFYRDTGGESFFASQRGYFAALTQQFDDAAMAAQSKWIETFFSTESREHFTPVLSLLGAGHLSYLRVNYDASRRDTHTVFAVTRFDALGRALDIDHDLVLRNDLHEVLHGYVNPLVDSALPRLTDSANRLLALPEVAVRFKGRFYDNPQYLMYESLVRATVILFLTQRAGGRFDRETEVATQVRAGFLWMPQLLKALQTYQSQRDRYPSFDAFLPQLTDFFERIATSLSAATGFKTTAASRRASLPLVASRAGGSAR